MSYTFQVLPGGNIFVSQNGVGVATTTPQNAALNYGYGGASATAPTPMLNGVAQPPSIAGSISAPASAPSATPKTSTATIDPSLYASARTAIQNGTMTPQQAQQYLSSYGTVDTTTLFAPMQYTNSAGQLVNLNSNGTTSNASATVQSSTTNATGTTTGGSGIQSTGNANLDAALGPLATQISNLSAQGQIPSTLEITPSLVGTFLNWAHSVVDPQTQAALSAEAANVNNALSNAAVNYQNTQAESVQGFGMNLLNEQNTAGASGTAFSGLRNLEENNMVNSENRTLSTNASNAALNIGNTLNAGGAAVGASNAGMFNLPTLAGAGTVSNTGGSTGGYTPSSNNLDFGYNPSIYVAGTIPSAGYTNTTNQEANYLNQYSTLAANNSNGSRSVNDLLGMITGAPAGATANLT